MGQLHLMPILMSVCFASVSDNSDVAFTDYSIRPVVFTKVHVNDVFWGPRLKTNKEVTLPANFKKSEETGRISNFAKAGKLMEGKHEGIFFNDSDVFKIVEGAAYTLATYPDPELDRYLDHLITLFAAAQEPDGYLYTARTINPEEAPTVVGKERWSNLAVSHELYNIGHMYEAAVAHYYATGKRNFLEVALKSADLVCQTFGPDKKYDVPGHQEIEMGLVKLYRVTHDKKYLDMAEFFVAQRGNPEHRKKLYGAYCQDHEPVEKQTEVVGHAVRAGYFYAGATDVAALTNNRVYVSALERLWENMVGKKIYITGGLGALHQGEQFGANYELPNEDAYAETCAAIAGMLWNHRMFLLHGDAKYMDVFERILYNGFLAGVSLSGDHYFYVNPLAADGIKKFNHGSASRQPWYDCSCCPTNVVRFIPSLPGYMYAQKDDCLYVNLFIAGTAELQCGDTKVALVQETDYPWSGTVKLTLQPESPIELDLRIRIPLWALGSPLPSDLYRYGQQPATESPEVYVNDSKLDLNLNHGYASIRRVWRGGEVIFIHLPMNPKRVYAHEAVEANKHRVAVERGPLVYCAEWVDNPNGVYHRCLPQESLITIGEKDPDTKIVKLQAKGLSCFKTSTDKEMVKREEEIVLIPYYFWAHRGEGEMQVWLAEQPEVCRPLQQ